jgi:hypothetical protein
MMKKTESIEEKILYRIPWEVMGLALFSALLAGFFFDPLTGVFIFAGGAVSTANFVWLRQVLTKALLHEKSEALKASAFIYGLRLLLILAIFFIIIFFFSKKILAFAAGFSSIILVILFEAVAAMYRLKTWKN